MMTWKESVRELRVPIMLSLLGSFVFSFRGHEIEQIIGETFVLLMFGMLCWLDGRRQGEEKGAKDMKKSFDAFIDNDPVLRVEYVAAIDRGTKKLRRYLEETKTSDAEGTEDALYDEVENFARAQGKMSTSLLQRQFRVRYGTAARLMDRLEEDGVIEPSDGTSGPRKVLL